MIVREWVRVVVCVFVAVLVIDAVRVRVDVCVLDEVLVAVRVCVAVSVLFDGIGYAVAVCVDVAGIG